MAIILSKLLLIKILLYIEIQSIEDFYIYIINFF